MVACIPAAPHSAATQPKCRAAAITELLSCQNGELTCNTTAPAEAAAFKASKGGAAHTANLQYIVYPAEELQTIRPQPSEVARPEER